MYTVGQTILDGMLGRKVLDYVFRKQKQVITMENILIVRAGTEAISIDSQLLFQDLVTAGSNIGDLDKVFSHELCSYPPALFESAHALLEAAKPALANAIWKQIQVQ